MRWTSLQTLKSLGVVGLSRGDLFARSDISAWSIDDAADELSGMRNKKKKQKERWLSPARRRSLLIRTLFV